MISIPEALLTPICSLHSRRKATVRRRLFCDNWRLTHHRKYWSSSALFYIFRNYLPALLSACRHSDGCRRSDFVGFLFLFWAAHAAALYAVFFFRVVSCRLGFSYRSRWTPCRPYGRNPLRRCGLHALPWRATCRRFRRRSLYPAFRGVLCSPQLPSAGTFSAVACPSPFVVHYYGTFAACCRILSARAYTFSCLCLSLGFGCLLRMLLCFGGLSFVRVIAAAW